MESISEPSKRDEELAAGERNVAYAVRCLRIFGGDLTRAQAGVLLLMWRHAPKLSADQVDEILAQFPAVTR